MICNIHKYLLIIAILFANIHKCDTIKESEVYMNNCCTFIGHRNAVLTKRQYEYLYNKLENLIAAGTITTFLLGSNSNFNSICKDITEKLKIKYPYIKRIYVRAEYQYIDKSYYDYLLQMYDDSFYPKEVVGANKLSYVKRNQVMIDESDIVFFYFNNKEDIYKSGTKIAYKYALLKKKNIENIYYV